jgi:hypothetical protein
MGKYQVSNVHFRGSHLNLLYDKKNYTSMYLHLTTREEYTGISVDIPLHLYIIIYLRFSLKSDRNNRQFTWRPVYVHDNISILPGMRKVLDKTCRKKKHTSYVQCISSENQAISEKMWKNLAQPDRPQII